MDKDTVDDITQQLPKLEEVLQTAFGLPRAETDQSRRCPIRLGAATNGFDLRRQKDLPL